MEKIDKSSGLRESVSGGFSKGTILALSACALSILQACSQSHAETPSSDPIIMADASGDEDYKKALEGTIDLDGNSSGAVVKVDSNGEITLEAQVQAMKPTPANYAVPNTSEEPTELSVSELQIKIEALEVKIAELEEVGASPRDIYMVRKDLLALKTAEVEIEKAETASEKAETAVVEKRLEESSKTRKAMEEALNTLGGG